jgi:septal ring factor EnvC (AmiA/AmiB activator)
MTDLKSILALAEQGKRSTRLLFDNCRMCVDLHHGHDVNLNGLPPWLRDCQTDIEAYERAITDLAERLERVDIELQSHKEWLKDRDEQIQRNYVKALDDGARIAKLETDLKKIAKQPIRLEMTADDWLDADFEGAYETLIIEARAALQEKP